LGNDEALPVQDLLVDFQLYSNAFRGSWVTTNSNFNNFDGYAKNLESLRQAGPFRLEKIIAQGGAGIIYLGVQETPLRRVAAVKVMRSGIESRHIRERFDSERQALAEMNHPNIESIFDAGTTDDGRPWFAMPYIDGSPITVHCDDEQLAIRERVILFLEVCAGISHAHAKGIIHRDLKPGNILVARRDGQCIPKIIDFGIAKYREDDADSLRDMTAHGVFLGTLAYTSPEQATLGSAHADVRSDIFSLGTLLHELLCGVSHLMLDPRQAGLSDLARFEPVRMSQKFLALEQTDAPRAEVIATRRLTTPAGLARSLRGDLDSIVMTALNPNPDRRYGTVEGLADDLRRMLDGRPVEATLPTRGYLISRFVQRHRIETIAVTSAVAIVFAALTTVSIMLLRERSMSSRLEHALMLSSLAVADEKLSHDEFSGARAALEVAPPSQRKFEWNYRMRKTNSAIRTSDAFGAQEYWLRYSPDGKLIAIVAGLIQIIDAQTFKILQTFELQKSKDGNQEVWWVEWSPDAKHIAGGSTDGSIALWDVATGKRIAERISGDSASIGAWIDETTIAAGSTQRGILFLDAHTLEQRLSSEPLPGGRMVAIEHAKNGPTFALTNGELGAFDTQTLKAIWRLTLKGNAVGLALSPDGNRLAVTYRSQLPMTIHDASSGALLQVVAGSDGAWCARWSPKGATLWTGGFDQRVLAFNGSTYELERVFGGSTGQIWSIDSAEEGFALCGGVDSRLREWKIDFDPARRELALGTNSLKRCTFTADGKRAYISNDIGSIYAVDLVTMTTLWSLPSPGPIAGLRSLKDGVLITVGNNGAVRLVNEATGEVTQEVALNAYCDCASISSDGSTLAVARGNKIISIALRTAEEKWNTTIVDGTVNRLVISNDDSKIAASVSGRPLQLLHLGSGRLLHSFNMGESRMDCAFSVDDQSVWTCTQESLYEVTQMDVASGEKIGQFGQLPSAGRRLTLAARAPRGAVQSTPGITKVFEPGKEDDLLSIVPRDDKPTIPFFAPNGDRLLLLRGDGVLECLDGSPIETK
jgi:serine/threonine protein kinase/outer membrane protein assembly factor BamB